MPFPTSVADILAGFRRGQSVLLRQSPPEIHLEFGRAGRVSRSNVTDHDALRLALLRQLDDGTARVQHDSESPCEVLAILAERLAGGASLTAREVRAGLIACTATGYRGLPLGWILVRDMSERRKLRETLVTALADALYSDPSGWPIARTLGPYYLSVPDPAVGVVLGSIPVESGALLVGNFLALVDVKPRADLVISLCRTGSEDVRPDADHVELWLDDRAEPANRWGPHLLRTGARLAVSRMRQGDTVFVHCAVGRSRSPRFAIEAVMELESVSRTVAETRVRHVLPAADPLTFSCER